MNKNQKNFYDKPHPFDCLCLTEFFFEKPKVLSVPTYIYKIL